MTTRVLVLCTRNWARSVLAECRLNHWARRLGVDLDPSDAEGGDAGKRRAFELTRQALGYRLLQLLRAAAGHAGAPRAAGRADRDRGPLMGLFERFLTVWMGVGLLAGVAQPLVIVMIAVPVMLSLVAFADHTRHWFPA